MAKTLYIIDGHAHIYAAYYAKMSKLTGPSGEPVQTTLIFTTMILKLIETKKPDMLVVAIVQPRRSQDVADHFPQRHLPQLHGHGWKFLISGDQPDEVHGRLVGTQ